MSAPMATRALSRATRQSASTARARVVGQLRSNHRAPFLAVRTPPLQRYLSYSLFRTARLTPESADPPPPNPEQHEGTVIQQPTELGDEEYHTLADEYMEAVHEKAEALQEAREDVDVEYSVRFHALTRSPRYCYLANTHRTRPASSQSTCPRKAPISSISSPRTNKSGSPRRRPARSDTIGWCRGRACIRRRAGGRAIGCT